MYSHVTLAERLWEQEQVRSARYLTLQDAAPTRAEMLTQIADEYDFTVSETDTLFSADNTPLQLGMEIARKDDPSERVIVVYDVTADRWLAYLPVPCRFHSILFIQAVQARVERNRQERLAVAGRAA